MRVGFNPNKGQKTPPSDYYHQVIVPVHIPNQEGYYKDSFQILKYCIGSLLKTAHDKTFISIVNNGSCAVVRDYLNTLLNDSKINEVIHSESIGKVNAVFKGLVGHQFNWITITDADVMFLNNWQKESYQVFSKFPKTGVVCTTPSSKSYKTLVANIYWDKFFSKELQFRKVKNPEALKAFARSIGNDDFYTQSQLNSYLTLKKDEVTAVVGAGHFVATYRGDVFNELPQTHSEYSLGTNSLHELLDKPVIKKGYWRLSTEDNYTYHMGNVAEAWMQDPIISLRVDDVKVAIPELAADRSYNSISHAIKNKYFSKLIMNKGLMRRFFIWKGLKKENAKEYLSW